MSTVETVKTLSLGLMVAQNGEHCGNSENLILGLMVEW